MGDGVVTRFILRHYYDLFNDSDAYDGVYICEKKGCGYKQKWRLEMCEVLTCPRCDGRMPLKVTSKDLVEKICPSP